MSSKAGKLAKNLKKNEAKAYADIAKRLVVVGFNKDGEPLCCYLNGKLENTFNVYCLGEKDRTVSDLRYPLPEYKYVNSEHPVVPLFNAVPNKKAFNNLMNVCEISPLVEKLPEGIEREAENKVLAERRKVLEEAIEKDNQEKLQKQQEEAKAKHEAEKTK